MEEMLAECPPLSLKSRFFLHSLFFFAQSSFLFLNNPPQTASCPNKEVRKPFFVSSFFSATHFRPSRWFSRLFPQPEEDSAEVEVEAEVEATDEATTRSRRGDR